MHNSIRKLLYVWMVILVCLSACIPVFSVEKTSAESITTHETEDHIYVFSSLEQDEAYYPYGNMILVESNGQYGLIDTKYHFLNKASFAKGEKMTLPQEENLSDVSNSGMARNTYMQDTLGITHLDFVILTNANPENIGGVSDICDTSGEYAHLVDDQTVFFYKSYQPINNRQDNLRRSELLSQAFLYWAEKQEAVCFDISQGHTVAEVDEQKEGYFDTSALSSLADIDWLTSFSFKQESPKAIDDYVEFAFGDFTIRLYNLYHWDTNISDNVNSIVTTITKGDTNAVLLSNLNNEFQAGEQLAKEISEDFNGKPIDILQTSNLATTRFDITKTQADIYQPKISITPNILTEESCKDNNGNFKAYCETMFGTAFYDGATSRKAFVMIIGDDTVEVKSLCGIGKTTYTEPARPNAVRPADGMHAWNTANGDEPLWFDYHKGKMIRDGWVGELHFDENGICTNLTEFKEKHQ